MATIQQALYYALTDDGTVGGIISARLYPLGDVPQDTDLEYLTYQCIDRVRIRHQGGDCGLVTTRYQIDCWTDTDVEAWTLAAAVQAVLHGHSGDLGESGSTVYCELITLEDQRDGFVAPTGGTQRGPVRVTQDYIIWYRE